MTFNSKYLRNLSPEVLQFPMQRRSIPQEKNKQTAHFGFTQPTKYKKKYKKYKSLFFQAKKKFDIYKNEVKKLIKK